MAEHEGAASLLAVVPEDDAEGAREYARSSRSTIPSRSRGEEIWLDWAAREPPLAVLVAPGGTRPARLAGGRRAATSSPRSWTGARTAR